MTDQPRTTVQVTHHYAVPAERVYDAWLDPAQARTFLFATDTGEMQRAEVDAHVGGRFTFVDRRPEMGDVEHVGEYIELARPRRIVFDFWLPAFSSERTRVAIDIAQAASKCDLTLTHRGVYEEYRDKTIEGWTGILEKLDRLFD